MRSHRRLALLVAILIAAASVSLRLAAQYRPLSPAFYSELTWRCIGPFDGGPIAAVQGVAGEAGVYTVATPAGHTFKTIDGGETWSSIPEHLTWLGDPKRWVDPANPRRIVKVDDNGIAVSLDSGATWTASHNLPIANIAHLTPRSRPVDTPQPGESIDGAPITAMVDDYVRTGLFFAATKNGVYVSVDKGGLWSSVQLNLPAVKVNDLDIRGNDLVAATEGRSVWMLEDISLLRQLDPEKPPSSTTLFVPSDSVAGSSVALDYYLDKPATGSVRLEVLDVAGRVVHSASSVAADPTDRWLSVRRTLPTAAGHHRVVWNLRVDPPPSPHHRFAQLARSVFENAPAEPDGPRVLPGTYRVRLAVAGQPVMPPKTLTIRPDPKASATELDAARREFELAMKAYDAMSVAHDEFVELTRLRAQIKPLLSSTDPGLVALFAELDTRLNVIDGSDWTGLVIPDMDDEPFEDEAKEGKHPDFVPPKPVSLSKDYDDPTSILGRAFGNVDHPPAFAILSATLGGILTKAEKSTEAPDALASQNYSVACQQLAGVLDEWRDVNRQELPRLNAELAKRKLPGLPVVNRVPTIACPAK